MSTLLERARRGECLADLDIVDIHGHFGRYSYGIPDLSARGLVGVMDRVGVQSIIVSHMQCMSTDPEGGNREVQAAMEAFPGRILGYAVLWPDDAAAVRRRTEHWLARGFTGLKFHNSTGFAYTHPAFVPALEMANDRRLPVLLHYWGRDDETEHVRILAERYADISFLLAHAGALHEERYVELARTLPNVYLELCMSSGPRGLVERFAAAVGVGKLVWGSDAYFLNMAQQIGKVLGADIPDADKRRILSANARGLLARIRR